MDRVPQMDLRIQYQSIREEINEAVSAVVQSGRYIMGPKLKEFEAKFAEFCSTRFAMGVANGTEALTIALTALNLPPGSEVITVPNTAAPTAEAITWAGLKIVFADINPDTYSIDPAAVRKAITKRTKALLPVHLFGQPVPLKELLEIASERGLELVEDCAQAHGAMYGDRRVGSIGKAGCFSFFPAKNLGAFGDGGAVVTNDPEVAETVRMLRDHGRKSKYIHDRQGYNSRLDELQAAVLTVKLRYLDQWNEKRRQLARLYDELLASVDSVVTPKSLPGTTPVYHQYVIRVPDRSSFMARLKDLGIDTGTHYPVPLHVQPAFSSLGYREGSFPVTESVMKHIVSLPMYPELTPEQVERVCDDIPKVIGV